MDKRKKAFTLIELLVVVAIIALLLSILTPALTQVRDRARRLLCANALKQYGIAIFGYNTDNNNLMFIPRRDWPGVPTPYPHYFGACPDYGITGLSDDVKAGEFSVYGINPYLDCVSKTFAYDGLGTKILTCPNAGDDYIVDWVYSTWEAFCAPNSSGNFGPNAYFIEPAYSYWNAGGPDPIVPASTPLGNDGDASMNALKDLTFEVMSSKRLLMSEIINLDGDSPYFRYNHGKQGWCWNLWWDENNLPPPGHTKEDGQQDATGRSQLFGDGRVVWRPISLKFEDNIPSEYEVGYHENEWNGPGSGWVNAYDISWY